ncbi:MAG: hypothetical protein K0U41_03670, partial [Gammaproteobacteria bacterium]|nr:hypothetical protein [Gammaproteobacteria bacterium]
FSQADNATRKYNALDTIQLYRGATEAYTLNYFIRARSATDGTGASNYALAQFSVAVRAPGSQEPPSISFTESVVANLNLNTNTEDTATFPIQLVLNSRDFLDSAITLAAGAITYDKVDFTIDQPSSPNLECSVSGNGLPLFSSGATSTPDRTGDGSTTIVGTLADGLAALTFGDIKSSSGNCANPEIGSSITAVTFTGVNATIVSSSSSTSDRTASFDVPINALLPTAADYTIQGYRIEPHQIALTVDGVGESGGQLQINTLPDSQTSITVTITDGDPDDGTPLDPTPNGNANIIRTGGPAAAWTSLQSSDVTLTSCPGISIDSVGSYTTVSGNAAAASVAIVLETSADADSVANNACTLSITTGEDGQLLNAGATIRVINPPRVFVDRLDTANTRVTTLANAVNDFNLDFASLDSGQKNALLNELATQGGLPNDFSNNVPFRVYSEGLFFIGVSVTAADPAVEAGTVTFMQSITADACVVTLVNAVRELDTNLDAGYASALYQITRTDAGGVCPAITIPVTQQGVTAMGSVILPAGSLIFDGVPAISEPQEVTGFIAYNTNITYESTVTDTDTSTDGSSPVVTASSGDANICRVTNPSITQQSDNSATATIQITPIAPGTCSITVSVTENGRAGTDRSLSLALPHTAPAVVANPDNSGLSGLQGSSISIKVEATKRDPGTSVAEFPRSITSAAPVCTASIGDGLGNIAVDYTNDQIGAIASVNYTVTSAFAIDCGAFTFTATENSEIGTAATLSGVSFVSPTSVDPTLTLNTGASMLNVRADALGSINLSISRNSNLLSDAIANPTLVVTASVPSSATCTANLTNAPIYSGNPQTATADFSVDWTGEEGKGGTCPVTINVQEQDRELVTLATTTIIFTAVGRVDIATNPSTFRNAFFTSERVTVTVTATKRDTLTGPDTGVIFRKPILVRERRANYCVVISPTSDTPRNFTQNTFG